MAHERLREALEQPIHVSDVAPLLARILGINDELIAAKFSNQEIRRQTVRIPMRDGTLLATDVYLPPSLPAPTVAVRTPYGRSSSRLKSALTAFACSGYAVVSQDCRGTGDSEPDEWDYYVYEREDSFDLVDWIVRQSWFDNFLGGCGGSYLAQTQWCMALHPKMSTIIPEVGGLGIAFHTARHHMFMNAYARSVGKGQGRSNKPYDVLEREMVEETLAGGYFSDPLHKPFSEALVKAFPEIASLSPPRAKRWLWEQYTRLGPKARAEFIRKALNESEVSITSLESLPSVFGQEVAHDAHMFSFARPDDLCRSVHAPALMVTGWYDWGLNDALATWEFLMRHASAGVRSRSRLLIGPNAHNTPGYHEGDDIHAELTWDLRTPNIVDLQLYWYAMIRQGLIDSWPAVTYYLMGANDWRTTSGWPPPEARQAVLYLCSGGTLTSVQPSNEPDPDSYTYDPENPTPTVGGSIVSSVYRPGSANVSAVQLRSDVVTYTTKPLKTSLDVVGPLKLTLYVSSSAVDTDFSARLSDVFPDGRAIQLQSTLLRTRYRDPQRGPELLRPGNIYQLDIDLWATANRFRLGHCLRLDVCSADFPRFDRNTNLAGAPGSPIRAIQSVYHDKEHPSHIILSIVGNLNALEMMDSREVPHE